MKGKTIWCLEEMVKVRHGREKWAEILTQAGKPPTARAPSASKVPAAEVLKLVEACASVLGIPLGQVMDDLDEYWSTRFAPEFNGVPFIRPSVARAADDEPVRVAA